MLIIGLTGGIGSGKTTVSRLFRELGAPIIDTDQIARKLTEPGLPAYEKIANHFGKAFIENDKRLNRARLRARVFESKEDRIWLERLLHPMIIDEIKQQIAALESVSYVIVEIPLLFESQFEDAVNRILVIDAPEQKQLERIMNRDGIPKEAVEAIMNTQVSRNHRLSLAHDVILNDGDRLALRDRVVALHHYYNELSNK